VVHQLKPEIGKDFSVAEESHKFIIGVLDKAIKPCAKI